MRRKWCRRRLVMLSIMPRQRAGEKGVMFKLVKSSSWEVHCETLFQKVHHHTLQITNSTNKKNYNLHTQLSTPAGSKG